jgi:hypothetical protein
MHSLIWSRIGSACCCEGSLWSHGGLPWSRACLPCSPKVHLGALQAQPEAFACGSFPEPKIVHMGQEGHIEAVEALPGDVEAHPGAMEAHPDLWRLILGA